MATAASVLDHISFGVRSIAACIDYLEGELGAQPRDCGPTAAFNWAQWRVQRDARIELIEPRDTSGFLHRFVEARGARLHHITFKVPSLASSAERARALGYDVTGYDDSQPDWQECFLHPKQALGVVIQIVEAHPELWTPPATPNPFPHSVQERPEPVDVQCLVMTAPDAHAAQRQFGELLGGAAQSRDGELWFSWPDSPHRILVELDATRAPGPKEVRVRSSRRLAPCPLELFGTPIVQVP